MSELESESEPPRPELELGFESESGSGLGGEGEEDESKGIFIEPRLVTSAWHPPPPHGQEFNDLTKGLDTLNLCTSFPVATSRMIKPLPRANISRSSLG